MIVLPVAFLFCIFVHLHALAQDVAVDAGWLTVRDINIEIKAGSPLDFSPFFPDQTAPVSERVEANARGQLLVKGKATRFLCASMNLTPPYGGFPTHEDSERYAKQLRRAGYNLVRIHHIDSTLMTDRQRDFDYDPIQLDRFQFFLAALKRQGIYWMLDMMSSENAAWGNVKPHRWVDRHDMKARIFVDEEARSHWKTLLNTLYGRLNPHTGVSILRDPALLSINVVNEGGLQFLAHVRKAIPAVLKPKLTEWLASKYADKTQFENIWRQSARNLETNALQLPDTDERSGRMGDVLEFFTQLQNDTGKWMQEEIRLLGGQSFITGYNNMPTTHMARARSVFSAADMHAYHDEALGFAPGARIRNDSSFDKGLDYISTLATARFADRPFTVSEYGQPFWNSWRRESALAGPGFAALQDWGALCQHASTAVDLTYAQSKGWKQSIIPYAVGLDPVGRVVETLAALLYRRGDVQAAKQQVEIVLPGGESESTSRYWGVPNSIGRVAFISGVSIRLAEVRRTPSANPIASITIAPENRIATKVNEWSAKIGTPLGIGSASLDRIAQLARPNTRTNAAAGVFESDTEELLVNLPARSMQVHTALTRAIVFEQLRSPWSLGPMVLLPTDEPSLVALSALDNTPLEDSSRMLLIVASDALNTDMRFSDASRRELRAIGRLPARIESRRIRLQMAADRKFRVSALRANGDVSEVLPSVERSNKSTLEIDISKLDAGPSFYFLVERLDSK
jgi:hypothetical protein